MVISKGTLDSSVRTYLSFYDSSGGAPALTGAFQEFKFLDKVYNDLNFTSQGMLLRHDGGVDIEFSRDGVTVEGRLSSADGFVVFDHFRSKTVFLRGAAADYRLWAW